VAGERHIHGVRNLSRETVVCECRDQADYGFGNSENESDQIRIGERWLFGEPVGAAGHLFNFAAVLESVKRPRMDSQPDGFTRSRHSLVLGEQLPCFRKSASRIGTRTDLTDTMSTFRGCYPQHGVEALFSG
jgi:hypothetical protein